MNMHSITAMLLTVILSGSAAAVAGTSAAHLHLGHVSSSWGDTPNKMGLLATASKEADIAKLHAALALKQKENLQWMKTHTTHVKHALDGQGKGPGLGYGVIKASAGVAMHIELAAASKDASKNIKLHSVHIATSAKNSIVVAQQMLALTTKIAVANSAKAAAKMLVELNRLAKVLSSGQDANNDGSITWVKGEGGLSHSSKHLAFLRKGENI